MYQINLDEAYVAYSKVLDPSLNEDVELEEDHDIYSGIEYLNHYDLGILAEEIVYHLLDEDHEITDIEEQFLESLNESFNYNKGILNEASVYSTPTVRDDSKVKLNVPSRKQIDRGYKRTEDKIARTRIKAKKAAKRAENIQKLKSTVKDTVSNVKNTFRRGVDAVKSGVSKANSDVRSKVKDAKVAAHGPLKDYAAKRGLHKNITSKAGNPLKSSSQIQTRGQSHRDQLRKAVVKDVGSRIRNKASQVAVGAYNKGREAVNSVKDTAGRAKQSVKNSVARTKRNVGSAVSNVKGAIKSGIGKAARKVADRMGEDIDLFDYISDFLISEGYADTIEDANYIMANELTEDQIECILDEGVLEVAKKYEKKLAKRKPGSKQYKETEEDIRAAGRKYVEGYEIVADYLMSEGYADDLDDVDYLIDNELTEDQIKAILEAKVDDGLSHMNKIKQRNHRAGKFSTPLQRKTTDSDFTSGRVGDASVERAAEHKRRRHVKKA